MTALSGAREGGWTWLRRLTARAAARDLAAFVVPGPEIARARGLDLAAAGLRPVATPRHANILVVVGDVPAGLRRAAAVAWAQMPRPRGILALGAGEIAPLPDPDVVVLLGQEGLLRGVTELRQRFADDAFGRTVTDFDVAAVRTATAYTCPMHPEIERDQQGSCPICGMDLVPREKAGGRMDHDAGHPPEAGDAHQSPDDAAAGAGDYTCPMHPDVAADAPGSCLRCGMDLVPRDAGGDEAGRKEAQGRYSCPMHPEIARDERGRCPICGMDLVTCEQAAEGQNQGGPGDVGEEHQGCPGRLLHPGSSGSLVNRVPDGPTGWSKRLGQESGTAHAFPVSRRALVVHSCGRSGYG